MYDKSVHRSKNLIEVTFSMSDGELFDAYVFLRPDERLIDLLNDDRAFIPVKREDGPAVILAKTSIVSIVERQAGASDLFRPNAGGQPLDEDGQPSPRSSISSDYPSSGAIPPEWGGDDPESAGEPAADAAMSAQTAPHEPNSRDSNSRDSNSGGHKSEDATARRAGTADGDKDPKQAARDRLNGSDIEDESHKEKEAPDAAATRQRIVFNPYKTLRVSPHATDAEIRRAYKARIKAVHPDTFSGLEIDDEISKAAILATQKVNNAYHRIMRERRDNARAAPHGEAGSAGAPAGASDEDAA